jgi:pantoate kinase
MESKPINMIEEESKSESEDYGESYVSLKSEHPEYSVMFVASKNFKQQLSTLTDQTLIDIIEELDEVKASNAECRLYSNAFSVIKNETKRLSEQSVFEKFEKEKQHLVEEVEEREARCNFEQAMNLDSNPEGSTQIMNNTIL